MAQKKDKSTRREFMKQSLSTLAFAALGGCVSPGALRSPASTNDDDGFDYIVIGSGAGGGPVACNLARAGHRVLLLEAGGNTPTRNYDVPAFHGLSTEDPNLSWSYFVKHYSDPAQQTRDPKFVTDKGVLYPRSGTLGGCTAHNAMITLYPDNQDWDDIASLTNDPTWKHEVMRQYFQRVERIGYARPLSASQNLQLRGLDGWLGTEQTSLKFLVQEPKLANIATAAAAEIGYTRQLFEAIADSNVLIDPNNWNYVNQKTDGIFNIPKATYRGRRNGTREHILNTMQTYPNLLVLRMNALVNRILLDETGARAVGVEYQDGAHLYRADMNPSISDAQTREVYAKKEVIVSAGAFNSPQLLMLSEIGPKDELDKHSIPVRVNLPGVGKNLQDRYEMNVTTKLNSDISLLENCTFGVSPDPCLTTYDQNPSKALYSTNGVVISIIKKSSPEKATPDLCLFATSGKFTGYFPGWSVDAPRKNYFTWSVLKGHTRNTAGTVTLKSADPRDTPEINFRYFDEGNDAAGDDMAGLLAGVKTANHINTRRQITAMADPASLPNPNPTDAELVQQIKDKAWGHHASCSNKMGPASDPLAVVDSKFRVHGIKNLRIVDASVFPKIPGLFIVVPVYMIAEKASDDILADA